MANLGPLRTLAGVWEGTSGADAHPVAGGTGTDRFVERYEAQPIDRQTNGPQLLYGLRYHTHIVQPGQVETLHDQVGYWLWEPATETVMLTLAIPRGQVLLAGGTAAADAGEFEVTAAVGSETYGISSNPFLDRAFRTLSYTMTVTIHDDDHWAYREEGVMAIAGRGDTFRHLDSNTLSRVAAPSPNPLARAVAGGGLGIGGLRQRTPSRSPPLVD
ncbi:MAG: heme-binding beta-barrel domain-containing protein [Acidimicrobiales bacterium]